MLASKVLWSPERQFPIAVCLGVTWTSFPGNLPAGMRVFEGRCKVTDDKIDDFHGKIEEHHDCLQV
jgi:hypothetical protein